MALAGMLLLGASAARAEFCERSIVHDYAAPLARLPELPKPPLGGEELPFGPSGLFLSLRGQRPLVMQPERLGFGLAYKPQTGQAGDPRVDWLITATLASVDGQGRTRRILATKSKRMTRPGPRGNRGFWFDFSAEPGLYRLEIVFENGAGKRLARFGEYVRALQPNAPNVRLALNGVAFRPGETVTARIENYGVGSLFFGLGYMIEFYDGTVWARPPIDRPGFVLAIGLGARPGEAASCWDFHIPPSAPPGLYRFVWDGDHLAGPFRGSKTPLVRTAEFTILPAGG